MQHQQEVTNGATQPQLNGNSGNSDSGLSVNGVSEAKKPTVKLDPINKQMVRLIGQHLSNLGFKSTVEHLMQESGCRLDHPEVGRFRACVLMGDWQGADKALDELQAMLDSSAHLTVRRQKEMRFLMLEQKYMELIECGDDIGALNCLRSEISPLEHNIARVHRLSSLIFYNNPSDLKRATNWAGSGPESRGALMDKLSKYLPASVMLPPRRLERLMVQALQHQISQCDFHNTAVGLLSPDNATSISMTDAIGSSGCLISDHRCCKESFPSVCLHNISEHTDEVLAAAFSPDGRFLATAGKDCTLIIWDVNATTFNLTRRHYLDGHSFSIVYLSWSHDSTKVIACMQEDAAELIVWDAERGIQVCKVSNNPTDSLTCACWYKDNERFVCGGQRGQFYLCNLEGEVVERWEGVRVQNVAIHADGRTVLASDTHHRIRAYQLEDEDKRDYSLIQEDHGIMSFGLDATGRYALLNINSQGVHMWDLHDQMLVRKFRGTTQRQCTIHSCFGGLNQDFVASGSEDNDVYIWHRTKEQPVAILSGHHRTVNCVTWNPTLPGMLASVSDDHTIRIWGPEQLQRHLRDGTDADGAASGGGDDEESSPPCPVASNGTFPHTLMSSLDISGH